MRFGVVLLVALALSTSAARADCVDEARELRVYLTKEASSARLWNTLWAIGFGTAAAGQVALALGEVKPIGEFDRAFEEQMYVGAGKATLGLAVRVVLPLRIAVPAAQADACADVVKLRAAIDKAGRKERRSVWLTLIGGTLVNLAGSAFLWSRHDFSTALQSFISGAIVGPISALTQPRCSWRLRRQWNVRAGVGFGNVWVSGSF